MKLTPARTKFLTLMSGTGGRAVRAVGGVTLIAIAVSELGWFLVLLPLGAFMIYTAAANFCPATLAFPEFRKEQQMLKDVPKFDLK
jgi:hypothetical protein